MPMKRPPFLSHLCINNLVTNWRFATKDFFKMMSFIFTAIIIVLSFGAGGYMGLEYGKILGEEAVIEQRKKAEKKKNRTAKK